MINIVYPPTLPDRPLTEGFTQTIGRSQVIETNMDTGPAKYRRRSMCAPQPYTMSFVLDENQVGIFEDWYDNTLQGGVKAFEWVHPIKRTPAYFQFTKPSERPVISPWNNAGNYFLLQINISMLP